jgi:hypothetical protein
MTISKPFFYLTTRGLRIGSRLRIGRLGFRLSPRSITPYIGLGRRRR